MSDLENFPVVREPTSMEVEYIEDVYRMGNYAGSFGAFLFFPLLSIFSIVAFFAVNELIIVFFSCNSYINIFDLGDSLV